MKKLLKNSKFISNFMLVSGIAFYISGVMALINVFMED